MCKCRLFSLSAFLKTTVWIWGKIIQLDLSLQMPHLQSKNSGSKYHRKCGFSAPCMAKFPSNTWGMFSQSNFKNGKYVSIKETKLCTEFPIKFQYSKSNCVILWVGKESWACPEELGRWVVLRWGPGRMSSASFFMALSCLLMDQLSATQTEERILWDA